MSQANELLDSLTEDEIAAFTAEPETEGHIIVGRDRFITVPEALRRIAVQGDHNVETVTFDCPRYWDENDISMMKLFINYRRPDGSTGSRMAENVVIDPEDDTMFHFDWKISNHVSWFNGQLKFIVCAKVTDMDGVEQTHWNSELNDEMYISEGLECTEEDLTTPNVDIIGQLLAHVDDFTLRANTTIETVQQHMIKSNEYAQRAEYAAAKTLVDLDQFNKNVNNQIDRLDQAIVIEKDRIDEIGSQIEETESRVLLQVGQTSAQLNEHTSMVDSRFVQFDQSIAVERARIDNMLTGEGIYPATAFEPFSFETDIDTYKYSKTDMSYVPSDRQYELLYRFKSSGTITADGFEGCLNISNIYYREYNTSDVAYRDYEGRTSPVSLLPQILNKVGLTYQPATRTKVPEHLRPAINYIIDVKPEECGLGSGHRFQVEFTVDGELNFLLTRATDADGNEIANRGCNGHGETQFRYLLKHKVFPEVVDARVGSDGTVHNSLGDAIRNQFNELDQKISREKAIPLLYPWAVNTQACTVGASDTLPTSYFYRNPVAGDIFSFIATENDGDKFFVTAKVIGQVDANTEFIVEASTIIHDNAEISELRAAIGEGSDTTLNNTAEIVAQNAANAVKGRASGSVVRLDDVSPLTHKLYNITLRSKNIIPYPYYQTSGEYAGVTVTVTEDGIITFNGTANRDSVFRLLNKGTTPVSGKYTLSGCTGGGNNTYYVQPFVNNVAQATIFNGAKTYDWTGVLTDVAIFFKNGTTFNNVTFKIMLEEGETASEYVPWSNSKTINWYGKNLYTHGTDLVVNADERRVMTYIGKGDISVTMAAPVLYKGVTYTISADVISSDTDSTKCLIYDSTNEQSIGLIARGERQSITFTAKNNIGHLSFYASDTYANGDGDTATFSNIQIEVGDKMTDFEPYTDLVSKACLLGFTANGAPGYPTSVYPTMTLRCDRRMVMDVEYNKDISKLAPEVATMSSSDVDAMWGREFE